MSLKQDERPTSAIDNAYTKGGGSYYSPGLSDAENSAFQNAVNDFYGTDINPKDTNELKDTEANPGNGWTTNLSNFSAKGVNNAPPKSTKLILKKFGPSGAVTGVVIGAAFSISSFMAPGSLLIHLKENFVNKFDTQNASFNVRSNKIINTRSQTTGVCTSFVTVACRYERPSNRFLNNLSKAGVDAVDKDGNIIKDSGLFPNKRPAKYVFNNHLGTDGKPISLDAPNLTKGLKDNPALYNEWNQGFNTRFVAFSDKVYKNIMLKFGFSKQDLTKDQTEEKARTTLNKESAGEDTGAKTAKESGDTSKMDALIEKLLGKEIAGALQKVARVGKAGSAVNAIAGGACTVMDVPGIVAKTVRGYQMIQLIKYASVILAAADSIKAGDATPAGIAAIGAILTYTYTSSDGSKIKAATDSFGIKYGLFGDTATSGYSSDFNKFSPGGGVLKKIGGLLSITDSSARKNICSKATNPITAAAVNVVLAANTADTFGASLAAAAVNLALGWAVGTAIDALAPTFVDFALTMIKSVIPLSSLIDFFMGDLTKDIVGEDVGNAFASGSAHLMGQTANAGANMPLSVSQAIAYDDLTKQTNLAYAEQDRVGRSPLDISSPNTVMGSIFTQAIPYLSSMSSLSGVFSSIGSISMGTFNTLKPAFAGAADGSEYKMCPDPTMRESDIAAGPFCNIIYGIPPADLEKDPVEVLNAVSGDIDPNTGEPKDGSDLKNWLDMCTDGSVDSARECKLDNDPQAVNYALYAMDQRVMHTMDDDLQAVTASTTSTSNGSSSSAATPDICKSVPATDSAQIACHSYQYSNNMYLWGGGHGGTAQQFVSDFKAGKYPSPTPILDCSGLVRMVIYETYGVDIGGVGSDSIADTGHFERVPTEQAKPGDLLIILGQHVEIVVENKTASRSFNSIGAHSSGLPLGQSIGPVSDWYNYDNISYVLRWKG